MRLNYLAFVFLFITFYSFSQVKLTGKITDVENKPIAFANVFLTDANHKLIKGGITDEKGVFYLAVKKEKYTLTVSFVGYANYIKEIILDKNKNLGSIILKETADKLKGVVVTTKKRLIEQKVDRLVFNVENSIAASGGDALDALKVTPRIRVQNDKITMIGKGGMRVMVNDRMIPLSGEDLVNYLQSISADDIKSIEVITTPPAKYSAEGNSGIINIKLKKVKQNSWSNTIRTSYKQATYPSLRLSDNFRYQKNRVSLLTGFSTNKNIWIYTNKTNYHYPKTLWGVAIYNRSKAKSISPTLNFGYKFSDKLRIGFQYLGYISNLKKDEENNSSVYDSNTNALSKLLFSTGNTEQKYQNHSLNINLQQQIDTLGKQFSVDMDYFYDDSKKNNPLVFNTLDKVTTKTTTAKATNDNSRIISNFSARIDFQIPYKWANLSFGGKLSFTKTHNKVAFSKYNTTSDVKKLELSQLDDFKYDENVQALYFSAHKKWGKRWDSKIGLRVENTQNKGYSKSTNKDNGKNYVKFFPTAYLSYKADENNTLSLSYSKRIRRPAFWELNPARWYFNANSYTEGNPFLQPSFSTNIDFSHSYKNLLTTTFSFSKTKDGFGQLTVHNIEEEKQQFIRRNFFDYNYFGITEDFYYRIANWWNTTVNASVYYMETNAYSKYLAPNYSGWGGDISNINSFSLNSSKTISAQLSYRYTFPSEDREASITSYSNLSIGGRFLLFKKQLQLNATANDILRSNVMKINLRTQGILQSFKQYYDSQYFRISLSYKFGNKKIKANRRKVSNQEEKNRL